jgi:hypothetical protein
MLWIYGSDSGDLDPDPALFVCGLQDVNEKYFFISKFYAYYFMKVHLHHSSQIKVIKKSQNSRNNMFLTSFA